VGLRVGVAMATYNGANYVRAQLESLARQVRVPDVVVVSDDASTDETVVHVEEFARRAPFEVRVVGGSRVGATQNFERALRSCDADLLFLADQDDVWLPTKIAKLEAALAGNLGAGLAFCDALVVDRELNALGYTLWDSIWFGGREQMEARGGRCFDVLLRRNVVQGCAMAFRREFLDLVLPFPPLSAKVWVHDGWIALLIAAVAQVEVVGEPLVLYRQHRGSQIGAPRMRGWERVRRRIQRARVEGRAILGLERAQYYWALERLEARADIAAPKRLLLREKVRHLARRANLPLKRYQRIPFVLAEAARGHYRRYGRGLATVVHDLVM